MFEDALPLKVKDVLKKLSPLIYEENFYLAGGTGLALQIGHRLSEDLDFFRNSLFNEESLIIKLRNRAYSFAGIIIEKFTVSVFFDEVRCSFFYYDTPLTFAPIEIMGIKVASWQDILAEKFKTVSQRGGKKDFYDIFATIKMKSLSIEEAVTYLHQRFGKSINKYHVLRSLTYFEDADEDPDPIYWGEAKYNWEEVKAFFVENVKVFERELLQ